MNRKFINCFSAAMLCLTFFVSPCFAQAPEVAHNESTPNLSAAMQNPNLNRYVSDADDTIKDGYEIPTFKNLSKMYWALAMFDLSDNEAIDNFLIINQCDLYNKFFNSDFELEGLREATRQSITANMSKFPMKYEILIPIGLDRYNIGTERFSLDPRSQFISAKRLEIVANNDSEPVCRRGSHAIPKYPKNFILNLNRPFTVTEIPVSPDVAQFYLAKAEKEAPSHTYRMFLSNFSRVAYIRLTVTINQFKGYVKPDTSTPLMAEVFGTIDSFELYGDRDKSLLMFNKSVQEKINKAKDQQHIQPAIPQGQLIETHEAPVAVANPVNNGQNLSGDTGNTDTRHLAIPGVPQFNSASPVQAPVTTVPQVATPAPAPVVPQSAAPVAPAAVPAK